MANEHVRNARAVLGELIENRRQLIDAAVKQDLKRKEAHRTLENVRDLQELIEAMRAVLEHEEELEADAPSLKEET